MKIRLSTARRPPRTALLVVLAPEGKKHDLGPELRATINAAHASGDLKTEFRKTSLFRPHDARAVKRLLFVGLGKTKDVDTERLRRVAALGQAVAEDLGVEEFTLWVDAADLGKVDPEQAGVAIAEGLVLGAYRYQPPAKEPPKPRRAQRAEVVFAAARAAGAFADGFALGETTGGATAYARRLGDQPGNVVTPAVLAQEARKLAGRGIRVRVLGRAELERLRMGALLGVARGSRQEPRLIVLEAGPSGARQTVAVVGKGLTFDTGGISIKPSAKMDEMRYDMCGAAAVLGLFAAIRDGALDGAGRRARVIGVIAAAENMPGGAAQKPGDVVTAFDGTTIEVLNTDAEGRLVLADALAWVRKQYAPDRIVDLATLTGAVVVALGHEAAAVLGTDDALLQALIAAGKAADEPLWQLPLWAAHREQMKSKFADLHNINSPNDGGGSIAGAAFLSYFVEGTPWAHLDIAGTAWGGRARDYFRSGATGTGVRTLVQWLRGLR
jgi:leucyl aminopeptidase